MDYSALDYQVPYYVGPTSLFSVLDNKQVYFFLDIKVDGYIVTSGFIIEGS